MRPCWSQDPVIMKIYEGGTDASVAFKLSDFKINSKPGYGRYLLLPHRSSPAPTPLKQLLSIQPPRPQVLPMDACRPLQRSLFLDERCAWLGGGFPIC